MSKYLTDTAILQEIKRVAAAQKRIHLPNIDSKQIYSKPANIMKAGIVPFFQFQEEDSSAIRKYLVCRGKHTNPSQPVPLFQIAMGGRLVQVQDNNEKKWIDQRDKASDLPVLEYEDLRVAALREGYEEIGLKPANINKLYSIGTQYYQSTRFGSRNLVNVYACEVKKPDNFLKIDETISPQAEIRWFTLEECYTFCREDHYFILEQLAEGLSARLGPSRSGVRQK